MRPQYMLALAGLMAMGSVNAFPEVEEDDIPDRCWEVCGKVVGLSHSCEGRFYHNEGAQKNCMCNWHGASELIPLCDACVREHRNDPHAFDDHDRDDDNDNDDDDDHDNDNDDDHDNDNDRDDNRDDRADDRADDRDDRADDRADRADDRADDRDDRADDRADDRDDNDNDNDDNRTKRANRTKKVRRNGKDKGTY